MYIHTENEEDLDQIHNVNTAAFETDAEAKLVDQLRKDAPSSLSLVAEVQGDVVGHIMFSPVTLSDAPEKKIMGLAPMAVLPDYQNQGIGTALVHAGIEQCDEQGYEAIVVLGHPSYYPRFGFAPSSRYQISCTYDVPKEAFMVMELNTDALEGCTGVIQYHDAFQSLE